MSKEYVIKKNRDTLLYIVSFMIPLIGFCIGIFFIIKPTQVDKKTGKKCLGWALAGFIIGSIITGFLSEKMAKQMGRKPQSETERIERMFEY